MRFLCNLGARRCNLGLPLEQSTDGDEIVLEVPEGQVELAERVAENLRAQLEGARKNVAVQIRAHP